MTYPSPDIRNWLDRRPMASIQISPPANVNIEDPATWPAQQAAWLAEAKTIATLAKKYNLQSVVVWDLSSDLIPARKPISYWGSPADLHPAFAPIADQFFATIKASGVGIGCLVRHTEIVTNHGGQIVHVGGRGTATVIAKIEYARDRWGMKTFYVDSNTVDGINTLPATTATQILTAVPDVVPIFEQVLPGYGRWGAAYVSVRGGVPIPPATPLVPNGPATWYCPQVINHTWLDQAHRADHVVAVRGGAVLMADGWYPNAGLDYVASVYHECGIAGF